MENRTVRFQIETDFNFQLKDKEDNQRSLPSELVASIGIFKALIRSGDDEGTKKTFSSKRERKKKSGEMRSQMHIDYGTPKAMTEHLV